MISAWFLKDLAAAVLVSTIHQTGGGVAFGAHVGGTLGGLGLISLEKLRRNIQPIRNVRPANPSVVRVAAPHPVEAPAIFLFMDGSQIGPFTLSQIRGMFSTGSVSDGTVYWREGMEDWRAADELRDAGTSA